MNTVEVLAWLPSFIPMGLIDLFVGLSQAKPNPNNRLFQGPQPTALKKEWHELRQSIFFNFFLAFMCFILKAANRVHVRSEPSLCQSTNDHLFRSGNVLVTSRGKRFMKSFFASGFQDWIWRFFPRMFNDIYWKLPAADGVVFTSLPCHMRHVERIMRFVCHKMERSLKIIQQSCAFARSTFVIYYNLLFITRFKIKKNLGKKSNDNKWKSSD